jgi:hypothetical protein
MVSRELLDTLSGYVTIIGFMIGLPTLIAAYFQSLRARQEAQQEREGTLHSKNCLEFVAGDGCCINLVPLETLHSLPRSGDIILLPGDGISPGGEFLTGAYLVESVEHIYMPWDAKGARPREARLTAAVAHVTSLNPAMMVEPCVTAE